MSNTGNVSEIKQGLEEGKEKLSEKASETKGQIEQQVQEYSNQLVEMVRSSPFTALGLAAALGMVVGTVMLKK